MRATGIFKYDPVHFLSCILFPYTIITAQVIPIAVLDFEGFGISQNEAIALSNRLRNELFKLGTFEVVDRGMMETILSEQDFQMAGCTSDECLVQVGRLIGAQQMVGGSVSKVGKTFSVSARVVDVETGKLLGVSDFDLKGELDDMLTDGMKIVSFMLAGRNDEAEALEQEVLARAEAAVTPAPQPQLPITPIPGRQPSFSGDAQLLMLYDSQKKNPTMASCLSCLIPSLGHAYIGDWTRGLIFGGARFALAFIASDLGMKEVEKIDEWGDTYIDYEYNAFYSVGMIGYIGLSIWEMIDVSKKTKEYNENLYKRLFSGQANLGLNMVPTKDGTILTLSYSF
ncbi:MAG: DUF2380 domain-containing protein [Candidatus Neomarinimicrobiota bacterium]